MRTDYVIKSELEHVIALLTPTNRLICQVSIATGLRIGDILSLKSNKLKSRMTIKEAKTGKSRRITMPKDLLKAMQEMAINTYVFASRDGLGKRSRQAVWADIKRAQKALRLPANMGCHSMRKIYAVRLFEKYHDLGRVMAALNHDNEATTMLYAMADHLTEQRSKEKGRKLGG